MKKKAFEISCALIRIAGYSGNDHFKSYLEAYSMSLLDSIESGNHIKALSILSSTRQFLLLGTFSGFLTEHDRSLMDSQISYLNAAINALSHESGNISNDLNLQDIFSESGNVADIPAANRSKPAKADRLSRQHKSESENGALIQRQDRILEIIRQSGNCRVKELQDKLPDISERTIRYDIQALVEQGKIERFGPGGPSTFYRLKTAEVAQSPIEEAQEADVKSQLWVDA